MIDFDVETTGVQWTHDELFLVTFYDGIEDPVVLRHPEDRTMIEWWLNRNDDYRAWNTKFDLHFLQEAGYRLPSEDRWHDGMVLAHVVSEQRPSFALKAVAESMFGEEARETETQVKTWLTEETKRRRKEAKEKGVPLVRPTYKDVPDEIMVPYAKQDVIETRRVCEVLERAITDKPELQEVYRLEMAVLGALYAAERRGLPVDKAGFISFENDLLERLETLHQTCVDLAGIDTFNPGSSKQIIEALQRRGANLGKAGVTAKGAVSVNEAALKRIGDPLCEAILEFRSEYKMLSTYVVPMLHGEKDSTIPKSPYIIDTIDLISGEPTARIHPGFRQVGARTGRMSCADPNVQNWPRDDLRLRYNLVADPGMKLVTADLSSIELVLFAAFLGEGRLYEAVVKGTEDPHIATATILGLEERSRGGGVVESKRQRGKTANYLMIYGGGTRTIVETFGVSESEARRMLDRYYGAYPEISDLQRKVRWAIEDRGYVKTPWGRRHRLSVSESYKAVNALVQGTAADLLKASLVRLHALGAPVIACVHDEIVVHCSEDQAVHWAEQLEIALTDHPRITKLVPLEAEAQIVDRWSAAKDPEFRPTWVQDQVGV